MNKRDRAILEMFELSELFRALGYESMNECLEAETVDSMEMMLSEQCCNFELELAELLEEESA